MTDSLSAPETAEQPKWQPISARERRVLGVLMEKAKTTPAAYPMTLNAICSAANQKSNRHPVMQLTPDDVELTLDNLRQLGAVAEIQGSGRVSKYRHYFYDWMGVDKTEAAVMTELLLRGSQTIGELRGRAARMEPVADLAALRPILDALAQRGLVIGLTPVGRGQVVTHALYPPTEMEKIRRQHSGHSVADSSSDLRKTTTSAISEADTGDGLSREIADLRGQVESLREEVVALRQLFTQTSQRES